ncbi:hydrogenase nickel incorporation protein HypB [Geobacter sp. DSM 9736]|uniref:hydrogenase nickel incorporation protein HypB n=1 Tax=Geobacter sp. DSM 9736 TaxID=1277350 RepID=UPI000B5134F2|nr:hydrogenase nickel incorporation protein HypB [Geobacter sp. DSM 9736]SNB45381.1 Hydrogenase nickel incorporation protein HypB [Geobacter sp. DSM 9736]
MCITCGCSADHSHHDHSRDHHYDDGPNSHFHHHNDGSKNETKRLSIQTDVLAKNDLFARRNRRRFSDHGMFVLNLVSSPGSGKTTLLERTLNDLRVRFRSAVIEGDQQTDHDAVRIAATGAPVRQINTGAGCHLDAHMVSHAVDELSIDGLDLLFIENVGNLVCPASFDLGEQHKVAVLSVTEGEDKPLKYPHMFRAADVMLINKVDLAPHVMFDIRKCREMAWRVNPRILIFEVSALTGTGIEAWYRWIAAGVAAAKSAEPLDCSGSQMYDNRK